jgi:hypothetical protein
MDKSALWTLAQQAQTHANDLATLAYIEGCGSGEFDRPPVHAVEAINITRLEFEGKRSEFSKRQPEYNAVVFFDDGTHHESRHATCSEALNAVAAAIFLAQKKSV